MMYRALLILFLGAFVSLSFPLCAQRTEDLKDSLTISVLHSNNQPIDVRSAFYPWPFQPSDSVASVLRSAVRDRCSLEKLNEQQAIEKALLWVHLQWRHDPVNSIADRASTLEILRRASLGEKFTCVEYAKVLSDIFLANGYAARMVGLSRRTISNPATGARHVGVELWSCQQNKWVFLDPQFGVQALLNDTLLSARELQRALAADDPNVKLHFVDERLRAENILHDTTKQVYRRFIRAHSAFLDVPYIVDGSVGLAMIVPMDRNEPLLFQGTPLSHIQYTKDESQLYAPLGQVHLDLTYNYNANSPSAPLKYPSYKVSCSSSFPWTRRFEVQTDLGLWEPMSGNMTSWKLHAGINEIHVRALCSSGCYTREASLKVYYGQREDARRMRHPKRETGDVSRGNKK